MMSAGDASRPRSRRPEAAPTAPAGFTAAAPRYAVDFDQRLTEEAVLLAVARAPSAQQARFHEERDLLYELADEEFREQRFRALHGSWFVSLGLGEPLRGALAAEPTVIAGTRRCRVLAAARPGDEYADLVGARERGGAGEDDRRPVLLLRLRPSTLLDGERLRPWLRRELMHVADLLDPDFGFDRSADLGAGEPGLERLVRERYRLLWEVTVDGRLEAAGELSPAERERRMGEFQAAFPMLGDSLSAAFERLWGGPRPSHAELAALARDPRAAGAGAGHGTAGRCPVCRMASHELLPGARLEGPELLASILESAPGWSPADGLCRQCADLFQGRLAPRPLP